MDQIFERMKPPAPLNAPYNLKNPQNKWFSQYKQDKFIVKVFRNMVNICYLSDWEIMQE